MHPSLTRPSSIGVTMHPWLACPAYIAHFDTSHSTNESDTCCAIQRIPPQCCNMSLVLKSWVGRYRIWQCAYAIMDATLNHQGLKYKHTQLLCTKSSWWCFDFQPQISRTCLCRYPTGRLCENRNVESPPSCCHLAVLFMIRYDFKSFQTRNDSHGGRHNGERKAMSRKEHRRRWIHTATYLLKSAFARLSSAKKTLGGSLPPGRELGRGGEIFLLPGRLCLSTSAPFLLFKEISAISTKIWTARSPDPLALRISIGTCSMLCSVLHSSRAKRRHVVCSGVASISTSVCNCPFWSGAGPLSHLFHGEFAVSGMEASRLKRRGQHAGNGNDAAFEGHRHRCEWLLCERQ